MTVAHALGVKGVLAAQPATLQPRTEREEAEDEWEQFRREQDESAVTDKDDFSIGREFPDDFSVGSEDD